MAWVLARKHKHFVLGKMSMSDIDAFGHSTATCPAC